MEEELRSVFMFVLEATDNPQPYYENIPEDFFVPSVFFPVPEIVTFADTFNSYGAEYSWYITFFHSTTREAYNLALKALTVIKEHRNVVPIIDNSGNRTGTGLRLNDPEIKIIDDGAVRLIIRFTSRRPYKEEESSKVKVSKILVKFKEGGK